MLRALLLLPLVLLFACGGSQPAVAPTPANSPSHATHTSPATVADPSVSTATPSRRVTLAAVGDLMFDRLPGLYLRENGPESPFAGVRDVLREADLTVGNLECAITDGGAQAPKSYTFRAPPLTAEALRVAGFDAVSLANNHALDWGDEGLADTRFHLDEAGVAAVGGGPDAAEAHRHVVITRNGLRVAFLGYLDVPAEGDFNRHNWDATATSPGLAWFDADAVRRDIAAARRDADLVVVFMHFGFEYHTEPSEAQRQQARAAIDAGAALVLGTHPHVLQPVEAYHGGVIAYSLGNFVFDGFEGEANESAIFRATLTPTGVESWELVPVTIGYEGFPVLVE